MSDDSCSTASAYMGSHAWLVKILDASRSHCCRDKLSAVTSACEALHPRLLDSLTLWLQLGILFSLSRKPVQLVCWYIHMYMHICICVHMCTHMCSYTHIYIYTYIVSAYRSTELCRLLKAPCRAFSFSMAGGEGFELETALHAAARRGDLVALRRLVTQADVNKAGVK